MSRQQIKLNEATFIKGSLFCGVFAGVVLALHRMPGCPWSEAAARQRQASTSIVMAESLAPAPRQFNPRNQPAISQACCRFMRLVRSVRAPVTALLAEMLIPKLAVTISVAGTSSSALT